MTEKKNGNGGDKDDPIEAEVVDEVIDSTALAAITKSDIEAQVDIARKYPRSIKRFLSSAIEMATLDETTAKSMIYAVPRAGKKITGPSARLAEVVSIAWTNLRVAARPVVVEQRVVRAQGVCYDSESNVGVSVEVSRSIMGTAGRFSSDMINVTMMAALSIARRNAILAVVPRSYVNQVEARAREAMTGKGTMEEKRKAAGVALKEQGIDSKLALRLVDKPGWSDVDVDDLVFMHGIVTSLKEGELTLSSIMRELEARDATEAATVRPSGLSVDDLKRASGASVNGEDDAKSARASSSTKSASAPAPAPAAAPTSTSKPAPASEPAKTSTKAQGGEQRTLVDDMQPTPLPPEEPLSDADTPSDDVSSEQSEADDLFKS
jgi:hypothetical protein